MAFRPLSLFLAPIFPYCYALPNVFTHDQSSTTATMTTFSVPDSTPSPSPASPKPAVGSYPQASPTPPKRPKRPRSPPISPLPERPGFSRRILKAVRNPQRTRWLDTWGRKTVAVKRVSANSKCTLDVVRTMSRLLDYPGLIRMVDYSGFGGKDTLDLNGRNISWEYGDLGNLGDLIYKNQNGADESLVWHVLVALLKSALYIHTGERYQPTRAWGRPPAEWKPLVHNAINPSNIFLMSPRKEGDHPIVKLGNFASASLLPSREHKTDDWDFVGPSNDDDDLTGFGKCWTIRLSTETREVHG